MLHRASKLCSILLPVAIMLSCNSEPSPEQLKQMRGIAYQLSIKNIGDKEYWKVYDDIKDQGFLSLHLIYGTTKAIGTARLADQYEIELCQQKLSERYKIEVLLSFLFFTIGGIIYLWIDKRRKKKYLELQDQLMESRRDILSKGFEGQDNTKPDSIEMLAPDLELSLQLFRRTEAYGKLLFLEKKMGVAASLGIQEGQMICESIYESFGGIMLKLKTRCVDLTKEDLLHCVFFLLGCSKETILLCTRASEGAFKSRKSRIKIKLGEYFFKWILACQYLVL